MFLVSRRYWELIMISLVTIKIGKNFLPYKFLMRRNKSLDEVLGRILDTKALPGIAWSSSSSYVGTLWESHCAIWFNPSCDEGSRLHWCNCSCLTQITSSFQQHFIPQRPPVVWSLQKFRSSQRTLLDITWQNTILESKLWALFSC